LPGMEHMQGSSWRKNVGRSLIFTSFSSDTAEAPSWNCLKGFDPVRLSDSVALKLEYQVGAGHEVQLNLHARFNLLLAFIHIQI
jgi:hypothetical protein